MHFLPTVATKVSLENAVFATTAKQFASDTACLTDTTSLGKAEGLAAAKHLLTQLHATTEMKDLAAFAGHLWKLLCSDKRLLIYGDYDLDGMSASAALFRCCLLLRVAYKQFGAQFKVEQLQFLTQPEVWQSLLSKLEVKADYLEHSFAGIDIYIPDRLDEGYGLGDTGVDFIIAQEYAAIITVDCGIKSVSEVERLRKAEIEVLLTDHHECAELLPPANFIVNPKQADDNYPNRDLSGSALVLKVAAAIDELAHLDYFLSFFSLEIAFLGIISDVMPLTSENQLIIKAAFAKISSCQIVAGLNALIELCKLERNYLTYEDFAFNICPKFNACGRIANPYTGVLCLLTADQAAAFSYAEELIKQNLKRKQLTQAGLDDAHNYIDTHPACLEAAFLVVALETAHPGVIGIIAANLKDEYLRPCICFTATTENGEKYYRASARATENFNLYSCLAELQAEMPELFQAFGGHAGACGLSIKAADFSRFTSALQALATRLQLDFTPRRLELTYNELLPNAAAYYQITQALYRNEPYGPGKSRPIFLYKGTFKSVKLLGKQQEHLALTTADGVEALIFNDHQLQQLLPLAADGDLCCLLKPRLQTFRNKEQFKSFIHSYALCLPQAAAADKLNSFSMVAEVEAFHSSASSTEVVSLQAAVPRRGQVESNLRNLSHSEIYQLLASIYLIFKRFGTERNFYIDIAYFLQYYYPKLLPLLKNAGEFRALNLHDFGLLLQILQELRIIKVLNIRDNIKLIRQLDFKGSIKLQESATFRALAEAQL